MPRYKVPPEPDYGMSMPASGNKRKKKRQPTVCIPMNPEWLAKMKVGAAIEVELRGKVVGIEKREDETESRNEIRLALDSVDYYSDKEGEVKEVMDDEED